MDLPPTFPDDLNLLCFLLPRIVSSSFLKAFQQWSCPSVHISLLQWRQKCLDILNIGMSQHWYPPSSRYGARMGSWTSFRMKPFSLRIAFNHRSRRLGNVIINQGNQQKSANPPSSSSLTRPTIPSSFSHLILALPFCAFAIFLFLPWAKTSVPMRWSLGDDPAMTKDTKEDMFEK